MSGIIWLMIIIVVLLLVCSLVLCLPGATNNNLTVTFFFAFQVSVICVRVPATCGSTEVRTDLPVRGKMTSTTLTSL